MAAEPVTHPTSPAPWWTSALDLVFPPRCVGCGRRGADVCDACIAALRPLGSQVCPLCGGPSAAGSPCGRCRRRPPLVRAILAAYPFEGAIRSAILAFKYRGRTRLVDFLASALTLPLQTRPLEVDAVVPVPLWPARLRERGFNQSNLLASRLAQACDWPLRQDYLIRSRDTKRQTELSAPERQGNVAGAFACTPGADVAGLRILLVDDVCTTGATLNACAAPLIAGGALGVWGLVVARDLPTGVVKAGWPMAPSTGAGGDKPPPLRAF